MPKKTQSPTLKLDGKVVREQWTPPSVHKVVKALESLADNELVSSQCLVKMTRLGVTTIQMISHQEVLKDYRDKGYRGCHVWGNRRAIAEFRRQRAEYENL